MRQVELHCYVAAGPHLFGYGVKLPGQSDIRPGVLMEQDLAVETRIEVDDWGQRLIVDDDELGCVDCCGTCLGDD